MTPPRKASAEARAIVYTDGASSGNPGPAGIGAHLRMGQIEVEVSHYIGECTNNVAEYEALIRGIEEAHLLGARQIEIYMDSELLVMQLKGRYKVRQPHLQPLYQKALALLKGFTSWSVQHVRRELNTIADKLSKDGVKGKNQRRIKGQEEVAAPEPAQKADFKDSVPTGGKQGDLFG